MNGSVLREWGQTPQITISTYYLLLLLWCISKLLYFSVSFKDVTYVFFLQTLYLLTCERKKKLIHAQLLYTRDNSNSSKSILLCGCYFTPVIITIIEIIDLTFHFLRQWCDRIGTAIHMRSWIYHPSNSK